MSHVSQPPFISVTLHHSRSIFRLIALSLSLSLKGRWCPWRVGREVLLFLPHPSFKWGMPGSKGEKSYADRSRLQYPQCPPLVPSRCTRFRRPRWGGGERPLGQQDPRRSPIALLHLRLSPVPGLLGGQRKGSPPGVYRMPGAWPWPSWTGPELELVLWKHPGAQSWPSLCQMGPPPTSSPLPISASHCSVTPLFTSYIFTQMWFSVFFPSHILHGRMLSVSWGPNCQIMVAKTCYFGFKLVQSRRRFLLLKKKSLAARGPFANAQTPRPVLPRKRVAGPGSPSHCGPMPPAARVDSSGRGGLRGPWGLGAEWQPPAGTCLPPAPPHRDAPAR